MPGRVAWLTAAAFLAAFVVVDAVLEIVTDTVAQRLVRALLVALAVSTVLLVAVNARALHAAMTALHELLPLVRKSLPDNELGVLSRREREIAALIGRGLTSREIADVLVITERTADTHADHIRQKLGVRSRAEIAAWARQHGLLRENGTT